MINKQDDTGEWDGYEGCLSELVQLPGQEIWEGLVRNDEDTTGYTK